MTLKCNVLFYTYFERNKERNGFTICFFSFITFLFFLCNNSIRFWIKGMLGSLKLMMVFGSKLVVVSYF